MKRIFGLLTLVFSFCLPLPSMADAADALPPGFIAISDTTMTWDQAKAFCKQQGGRLPLIGVNNSIGGVHVPNGTSIDGFGAVGDPWPAGLPNGDYWTDTVYSVLTDFSWYVGDYGGRIALGNLPQQSYYFVAACVPYGSFAFVYKQEEVFPPPAALFHFSTKP